MKKILLLFAMLLSAGIAMAQNRQVTGKVTDGKGEPVPYASVKIKNTNSGTSAEANGDFKINAKTGDVLQISAVGFSTKEVAVTAAANYSVSLEGNSTTETVVVTGYASRSKKSSVSSVSTVSIDDVRTQPIASFDQLLQGQAPGVFVSAGSGQPGAAAKVQIRGVNSINGSTTPLYIVDGIEITAGDFSTINAGDFESVTVLKDATAAGIYGSRGANGVIVATTKKGRAGGVRVQYDAQYGQSYFPRNKLKLMNSNEKLDYEIANGNPNGWSGAEIDSLRNINTDWEDVFFRTGQTHSHQIALSGGNDKTRFYTSLNLFDQTGTVKATALKRYTARFNIENTLKDFKIGLNSSFGFSRFTNTDENDNVTSSPLNSIRWTLPYFTPYDKNGNYLQDPTLTAQPNALQELLENKQWSNQIKALANASIEYKFPFLKGLSFRTNWGFDYMQDEGFLYYDPSTSKGQATSGEFGAVQRAFQRRFRYQGTNSLTYKTVFGNDRQHDLTVSAYQEVLQSTIRNFAFTGYGLELPFDNEAAITQGTESNNYIANVNGAGAQTAGLLSFFGDATYGYKNKYFVNAIFRRDGSDRFGTNKRWGNFGGGGVSWVVSDEEFLKGASNLNLLKVRLSYGSLGNQRGLANFGSLSLYGRTTYAGQAGLTLVQVGNPDLQWETKTTFNAGIDFGIFKNRVSGSVEYFNSKNSNLLTAIQVPGTSTGFATVVGNNAALKNNGIEVSLKVDLIKSRSFSWTVDGNFTYVKNKITELPNDETPDGALQLYKVGEQTNKFYLVRYAGVDPATGDALYYDKTGKITNVYNANDRVLLGSSDPNKYGGITNTFNYKGLELSAFWVFSLGNDLFNQARLDVENSAYIASNLNRSLLREWRNPGDITDIPRATQTTETNTSRFLENGGYWRLRNVMLSYNLPKVFMDKMKLNSARIFLQGQNLVTITKFLGSDPEVPNSELTGAQYPSLKTITLGVSVGF